MKTKVITVALALPVVVASAPALAERYQCITEKKFVCDLTNGCQPVQADTKFFVDLDAQTYTRCDLKRCDKYDAKVEYSGVYISASRPGTMLKLLSPLGVQTFNDLGKSLAKPGEPAPSVERSTFVDVATLGTSAFTSMGICRPVS